MAPLSPAQGGMLIRIAANIEELRRNLAEGRNHIETTTAAMTKLASGLEGNKLIQSAHNIVAAVDQIGGATRLTEAEKARLNATLAKAIEKYQVLGKEAPAAMVALEETTRGASGELDKMITGMTAAGKTSTASMLMIAGMSASGREAAASTQQIASAADGATSSLGSLHQGLSATDRILASLGINIGPQVRAIGEMAAVSGKTASQLGLVAVAGLSVSAAFAGWQLGRWVADWFDLDEAIGNATAKLLGWGDAAAETAGAKMDVLARASKLAGTEITNFGQALKIIKEDNDRVADSFNTSEHRVGLWRAEIAKVKADGNLEALTKDIASGNSTMKEMSSHYDISTRALEFFVRENRASAEAVKANTEAMDKATAAAEQVAKAYRLFLSDNANKAGMEQMNDAIAAQERALENANGEWLLYRDAALMATAASDKAAAATAKAWDDVKVHSRTALQETAEKAQATYAYVAARAEEFAPAVIEKFRQTAEAARVAADTWGSSFVGALDTVKQKVDETTANVTAAALTWGQAMSLVAQGRGTMTGTVQQAAGPSVPYGYNGTYMNTGLSGRRETGGPVDAGGRYLVGERGPELFMPGSSGTIVPNGGGSTSVTIAAGAVQINYPLMNDPRARMEIAAMVGDALMARLRQQGLRVPSGA